MFSTIGTRDDPVASSGSTITDFLCGTYMDDGCLGMPHTYRVEFTQTTPGQHSAFRYASQIHVTLRPSSVSIAVLQATVPQTRTNLTSEDGSMTFVLDVLYLASEARTITMGMGTPYYEGAAVVTDLKGQRLGTAWVEQMYGG